MVTGENAGAWQPTSMTIAVNHDDRQTPRTIHLPLAFVPVDEGEQHTRAADPSETDRSGLPLSPPKEKSGSLLGQADPGASRNSISTVITSLAVVLGLFALLVWFARQRGSRGCSALPVDAVDTLGRVPLNKNQEMHLVRIGNKLLLLAVTPTSAETLTEITDPQEITRLSQICQQSHAGGLSASFRQVLSQLNNEPAAHGHFSMARQ